MTDSPQPQNVLVTGDLILDYHIYEGSRQDFSDGVSPGVRVVRQPGGAAIVNQFLGELLDPSGTAGEPGWTSRLALEMPSAREEAAETNSAQTAYAFWRPFPRNASREKQYWRVSEAMGFGATQEQPPCETWTPAPDLPDRSDIIVLAEGGMGFRDSRQCWETLPLADARAIILKTAAPLCTGELWERLSGDFRDRLMVVVSARELRKTSAQISQGLSWERTISDLLRELDGPLQALRGCRHLFVSFESEGGVYLDFGETSTTTSSGVPVSFVYDAASIEGDHSHATEGGAFGFLSCLAASIAWQTTLSDDQPDLTAALEGGLSAMRRLREQGHGPAKKQSDGFPAVALAGEIQQPSYRYSRAKFCSSRPTEIGKDWSLLGESQRLQPGSQELARLLVLHGPIAIENLPHLEVGHLLSIDHREIESLRTLSLVIRRYVERDSGKKPLSLGVFGPPGAGKSFAVQQIANSLVGEKGWMEFNLSQFDTPADLIGAFHQIRDRVLRGLLPVAFFDEFDSQKFRWLQYLLAPMQDGKFQEGQITHPIGKCVFVFAGGTSWTFENFGPPQPEGPVEGEFQNFRLAKGPDFQSRLDAYLNVIGPNQRQVSPPPEGADEDDYRHISGHCFAADPGDQHHSIRRALMIRPTLGCSPQQTLTIDEGLLNALLNVESYRHGSRSLAKIVQPLKAALPGPIHRSLLPPQTELAMHTSVADFQRLADNAPDRPEPEDLTDEQVETIAPAIHRTYNAAGIKEGWLKSGDALTFEELKPHKQSSNLAAARRMPHVLDLIGLQLAPGTATPDEQADVRQHIEYHLELLARYEHIGWMEWLFSCGFRYGPVGEDDEKIHPCLIDYEDLSDAEKNKDRTQIRMYPQFAREAGMHIVDR